MLREILLEDQGQPKAFLVDDFRQEWNRKNALRHEGMELGEEKIQVERLRFLRAGGLLARNGWPSSG